VRIRIPAHGLVPGLLARAELPVAPHPGALVVPVSAVLQEDGTARVFVIHGDTLERRSVELGLRSGDLQIITAGLKEGETIAARDVAALSDGQRVAIHGG